MEPVAQLTDFYETIAGDARIGIAHISLYTALLHELCLAPGIVQLNVDRDKLISKVKMSRKTYNKCLKELNEYGYIRYEPSLNPFKKSKVHLNKL